MLEAEKLRLKIEKLRTDFVDNELQPEFHEANAEKSKSKCLHWQYCTEMKLNRKLKNWSKNGFQYKFVA